jgi:hypothetical protein
VNVKEDRGDGCSGGDGCDESDACHEGSDGDVEAMAGAAMPSGASSGCSCSRALIAEMSIAEMSTVGTTVGAAADADRDAECEVREGEVREGVVRENGEAS